MTSLGAWATPISNGNISSVRFSTSTLCTGTNPISQPSAADCTVEGSDSAILPNSRLYGLVEGRLGDRSGAATYELGISNSTPANVLNSNFNWVSGQDYNFSINFTPSTATLVFALGNAAPLTYVYPVNSRQVDALLIRTTSRIDGATATVQNLRLTQNGAQTDFGTARSQAAYQAPGYVDYLYLSGLDSATPWTLNGVANFAFNPFTGNQQSNLAFQIKLGDDNQPFVPSAPIPEPATFLAAASGLFALRFILKRR